MDAEAYLDWFMPFAREFQRILAKNGSLVIDIAGAWTKRRPTRSLYHLELPIRLCRELGFHLAQEFFWWSPNKLPTPQWATIERVRVKDAVDCVWWLSPSPWPKASNRRVLTPYGATMRKYIDRGRSSHGRSHSGHHISRHYRRDNGGAIPSNMIALANPGRDSAYFTACKNHNIKPHPARFPTALPEFFIRMCTDPGDLVLDPFGGSGVSAAVAQRLQRRWVCIEVHEEYVKGAQLRLEHGRTRSCHAKSSYQVHHPAVMWEEKTEDEELRSDGGRNADPRLKHSRPY